MLTLGDAEAAGVLAKGAIQPPHPILVPFCFWWPAAPLCCEPPEPAALGGAICAHLADLGWPGAEPLRWAITAVDPGRGLRLEGVGVMDGGHERPGPRLLLAQEPPAEKGEGSP